MKKNAILWVALSLISACANAPAQSGYQLVKFTSEPSGALVSVGELSCITPCSLGLTPGNHLATIRINAQQRDIVVVPRQNGMGGAGKFQLVLGNGVHATGMVLSAVGEAGMQLVQGGGPCCGDKAEAAVFLTVGLVSIGSAVVGKVMIKAGQAIVDQTGPRPTEVHVVLTNLQ